MHHSDYHEAKRYMLELVLIGMALGGQSSRQKITAAVDAKRLSGTRNRGCIDAIGSGDSEAVRGWIGSLGVPTSDGVSVVDSVIAEVIRLDERERLGAVLAELTTGQRYESSEAIRSVLADAMELLDTMEPVA